MCAVRPVIAPQGIPGGREALAPVAGDLKDRPQAVANHLVMGVERLDAPDRPALAIVTKRLGRDRNRLGAVGRARGHREHEDFGARAEEGTGVAVANAIDVGLMAVVAADRHATAEICWRANLAEVVVAAELAVGVAGDPAQEQLALHVAGAVGLVEERPGEPARAVRHRPAEQPLEERDHDRSLAPGCLLSACDGRRDLVRYIGTA